MYRRPVVYVALILVALASLSLWERSIRVDERVNLQAAEDADYVEQRKELDDVTDNLPTDSDSVVDGLQSLDFN